MDPHAFIRLSIGYLGLRAKSSAHTLTSPCVCEIRLRGFPIQKMQIPIIPSSKTNPDSRSIASSFYLQESDLKSLLTPKCFYASTACLEIAIFSGRKSAHCGVGVKRQQIGTFKLDVSPEWCEGKSTVLFEGWSGISKNRGKTGIGADFHLRVKLEPDPRYVFRFEDETKLSPQIVQLQGSTKQPIFSCKFSGDRGSEGDPLISTFRSNSSNGSHTDAEKRERKGWKVKIHDLSGSAIAAAFITTPFVPSTGCDWVAKSNPGAWLIVHPDPYRPNSWQPWGKLEAWRQRTGIAREDSIFFRFHLLSDGNKELLMSEVSINAEKGGEFLIDSDRPAEEGAEAPMGPTEEVGFVMSCRMRGEGMCSEPVVQLAVKHVTCVEDAAIFMALAAAVDLSVEACRPFRRRVRKGNKHCW
ncbi:hypothetical protein ACP275_14G166600 [Erythranthe tilingii]